MIKNYDYLYKDLYKGENKGFKTLIDDNKDTHIFQENIDALFTYEFDEFTDNSNDTLHFTFTEHFFKSVVGLKVWKKRNYKEKNIRYHERVG